MLDPAVLTRARRAATHGMRFTYEEIKDVAQILLIVFQPVCASTGVVVHHALGASAGEGAEGLARVDTCPSCRLRLYDRAVHWASVGEGIEGLGEGQDFFQLIEDLLPEGHLGEKWGSSPKSTDLAGPTRRSTTMHALLSVMGKAGV